MDIASVMSQVNSLAATSATKEYIGELLQDMVQAKNEKHGKIHRCELQGIINGLEREGTIDANQHRTISAAIGELWVPVMRALIVARIAQDERDFIPVHTVLAALELARDALDNTKGNINPERGYAEELECDVLSALASIESLISRCNRQRGGTLANAQ